MYLSHLYEVSTEFPAALFLLEYVDMQMSYAGRIVIYAGKMLHEIHDDDQQAQGLEWVLLDIFAPYRAEYDLGVTFGSLWNQWVADMSAQVTRLNGPRPERTEEHRSP